MKDCPEFMGIPLQDAMTNRFSSVDSENCPRNGMSGHIRKPPGADARAGTTEMVLHGQGPAMVSYPSSGSCGEQEHRIFPFRFVYLAGRHHVHAVETGLPRSILQPSTIKTEVKYPGILFVK